MTSDDIIRMAREAGLLTTTEKGYQVWMPDNLEAFAALIVAEQERILLAAYQVAMYQVAAEREACAAVCREDWVELKGWDMATAEAIRKAIRARGEK